MNVYFGVPWDKEGVHDPHNLIGDTRYIAPQHLIDAPHPYEGKRFVIVLEEDCSTELLQKKCFALDYAWNNGSKYLIDLSKHDYILLEENHMMVGSAEFLQREHQQTPKLSIQEFMDGDRLPNFPIGGRISGRHADKMMEESLKYKDFR